MFSCSNKTNNEGNRFHRILNSKWLLWLGPIVGFLSFLWFLIRVIPKPSRASYPCQRAAFPIACGFIAWLMGGFGALMIFKKAHKLMCDKRIKLATTCFIVGTFLSVTILYNMPSKIANAEYIPPTHTAIGTAKGVNPGRVVWVHDPEATNWKNENWESLGHTNQIVTNKMLSKSLQALTGAHQDSVAWDRLFRYFNIQKGRGDRGYIAGEKITIKINLTNSNTRYDGSGEDYNKTSGSLNSIDNSPELTLSLLSQLVNIAGISQQDITIGDPTCRYANHSYNYLHAVFPNVNYWDIFGDNGRTEAQYSTVRLYWSTSNADSCTVFDYVPQAYVDADYVINFSVLKGHTAGITICAKNHYGSLIRLPDKFQRVGTTHTFAEVDLYSMHESLPQVKWWTGYNGLGYYRALVDLMGHPEIGGKTMLYLVDALFCGQGAIATNHPKWQMAPFNDDYPSSLFVSQDPVAIDSVGLDFLCTEWNDIVSGGEIGDPNALNGGAEDYLHEAAEADDPASGSFYDPSHSTDVTRLDSLGIHEHWDNSTDMQYSRNLSTDSGIELLAVTSDMLTTDINGDNVTDVEDLATIVDNWLEDQCYKIDDYADGADIDQSSVVDLYDFAVFAKQWENITTSSTVDRSSDDAEERENGNCQYTSGDLDIPTEGTNRWVGVRFNDIDVPNGATIVNAYVQFVANMDDDNENPCSITIWGQDTDDAPTFTMGHNNISDRTATTAEVVWLPVLWYTAGQTEKEQATPDLSQIIQEIVDRAGYTQMNSIVLVFSGTGKRIATSYDGNSAEAPVLHIEYKN